MADIKKPSYSMAYDARIKEIQGSIESPHKGEEKSRDPEMELKPTKDSTQLGEDTHR
jgi:hypothetical protein